MAVEMDLRPSPPLRVLLPLCAVLALGLPRPAAGAEVQMSAPAQGCGPVVSGTGACLAGDGELVDVTFALGSAETLNGYDLEIRWDPAELTLVSATQLHPDTGTPGPFTATPSDPAASRAAAFELQAAPTTQLFRLRFQASPGAADGQADLSWFPNNTGLSPPSVVLDNASGAAIDFGPAPAAVPSLDGLGRAILGLLLTLAGTTSGRWRPRWPPFTAATAIRGR